MVNDFFTEEEMEVELTKRGHEIYTDADDCIDSSKVADIAVNIYGFESKLSENELLEFTGKF